MVCLLYHCPDFLPDLTVYMSNMVGVSYKKHELLALCKHLSSPPGFGGVCVAHLELFVLFNYVSLRSEFFAVMNLVGGVMVSVLASSEVDREFEPLSGQIKDYKNGICCFSARQAALRRKHKYWLARNQNNAFEWSYMSTRGLLFQ